MRVLVLAAVLLAAMASAAGARVPSDPAWPQQWGARKVNLPDAWDATVGDPAVVIAYDNDPLVYRG